MANKRSNIRHKFDLCTWKKNIAIIKMYSINPETSFDLIALYSFCEYDRM